DAGIGFGVLLSEPGLRTCEIGAGLLDRHIARHPGDPDVPRARSCEGRSAVDRDRKPEVRAPTGKQERLGHYADDLERLVVEPDVLADNVRRLPEAEPPVPRADHDRLRSADPVLVRSESAAENWRHAERLDEARRVPRAPN